MLISALQQLIVNIVEAQDIKIDSRELTSSIPPCHGLSYTKRKEKDQAKVNFARSFFLSFSDSRGIQTHNLLIRSQMLYSVELGSRSFDCGCKGT